MIERTNVVSLSELLKIACIPIDTRTVAQDRALHKSLMDIRSMTHIVQVADTSDENAVANAARVALSPAQRAFIQHVFHVCFDKAELVDNMSRLLEAFDLSSNTVLGDARGWTRVLQFRS